MIQVDYKRRRAQLMAVLPAGSVAFIRAAALQFRNGDTHYPYRQHSDFYYLTGFEEPEALLVLIPDSMGGQCILFNREKDPLRELWEGARLGQAAAPSSLGVDKAYPMAHFKSALPGLLQDKQAIYSLCSDTALKQELQACSEATVLSQWGDLFVLLSEMRLLKDEAEIEEMRTAASISARAHRRAMEHCVPGMKEYELSALLEYECSRQGCRALAYPSIVGGGENACVLHYTENNAELKDGDLVLVDAGGEYHHYASDITRTYPVNGTFSAEQRALYELVLKVQLDVIASIAPGVARNVMQDLSERLIAEGLLNLGILKGSLDQVMQSRSFDRFYPHRIGHWLGLDVHDVGAYKQDNVWRPLAPGMVLTVEPGLYIPAHSEGVDPRWWGIGIRIEDDILVTKTGCEVLSIEAPKSVAEIERVMRKGE